MLITEQLGPVVSTRALAVQSVGRSLCMHALIVSLLGLLL